MTGPCSGQAVALDIHSQLHGPVIVHHHIERRPRLSSPASLKKPTPPARSVLSRNESTSSPSIQVVRRLPWTSTANCMGRLLCTITLRSEESTRLNSSHL